jgi:ectoine hydroxylase-related dioxygenase (phytanoyl-CoA dioxygenase family)
MPSDITAITDQDVEAFQQEGVIFLKGAFKNWVDTLQAGVTANMVDPSWRERSVQPEDGSGHFFQDLANWDRIPEYRQFVFESPAAEMAATLMGSKTARFFHDHVLVKEPGSSVATPWHHDLPYYCVDGDMTCSFWIPLDPVSRDSVIEYVAGSHSWGKQFRPERFNGTSLNDGDTRERIPDVNARRDEFDVRGWDMEPGDAIAFSFTTIHGAPGNSSADRRRRAFSARWVGDDAVYMDRGVHSPPYPDLPLKPGDPLDGPDFPLVYPAPA